MEVSNFRAGRPPHGPKGPGLGMTFEQALRQRENGFLSFACTSNAAHRELIRHGWRQELQEYLELGFMADEDTAGPVRRQVDSARDAAGVVPGEVNLALDVDVEVFGFLNRQQLGDCYFLHHRQPEGSMFFTVCIESGVEAGGPYDIYVSPAQDWATFLRDLPAA